MIAKLLAAFAVLARVRAASKVGAQLHSTQRDERYS
jgi:hypothetical protein